MAVSGTSSREIRYKKATKIQALCRGFLIRKRLYAVRTTFEDVVRELDNSSTSVHWHPKRRLSLPIVRCDGRKEENYKDYYRPSDIGISAESRVARCNYCGLSRTTKANSDSNEVSAVCDIRETANRDGSHSTNALQPSIYVGDTQRDTGAPSLGLDVSINFCTEYKDVSACARHDKSEFSLMGDKSHHLEKSISPNADSVINSPRRENRSLSRSVSEPRDLEIQPKTNESENVLCILGSGDHTCDGLSVNDGTNTYTNRNNNAEIFADEALEVDVTLPACELNMAVDVADPNLHFDIVDDRVLTVEQAASVNDCAGDVVVGDATCPASTGDSGVQHDDEHSTGVAFARRYFTTPKSDMNSSWVESSASVDVSHSTTAVPLPHDLDRLKSLRETIVMEILWIQQAIDSRKNYLRLKSTM